MSLIKELFGDMDANQIHSVFGGYSNEFPDFEAYPGTFNLEEYAAWHIVNHKPTGKLFGIREHRIDSWIDGSMSNDDDYFEIHELKEVEVRAIQHVSVCSDTIEAEW